MIKRLTLSPNSLVTISIQKSWLKVLRNLHALAAPVDFGAQEMWREVGMRLNLDEEALFRHEAALQMTEMGGLAGCSWWRCPLNLRDDSSATREMLRCCGCGKVRCLSYDLVRTDEQNAGSILYTPLPKIVSATPVGCGLPRLTLATEIGWREHMGSRAKPHSDSGCSTDGQYHARVVSMLVLDGETWVSVAGTYRYELRSTTISPRNQQSLKKFEIQAASNRAKQLVRTGEVVAG